MSAADPVRRLGHLVETVHAVLYFAPEAGEAYGALGLRGFWRGYFAGRAAPLGATSAELVTALFAGFAPAMVARVVPEVWQVATPEQVQRARLDAAVATLRRLLADVPDARDGVAEAAALTGRCVAALPLPGRPMAAAQAALPRPQEPLAALWHDCTVLREHRGDAHLVAVAAAGLEWPEPHLLAPGRLDPRQQALRGWDDAVWQGAAERVRGRDTDADAVEDATDALAAPAYAVLDVAERARLAELLAAPARAASAQLPYPNTIGLPPLTS